MMLFHCRSLLFLCAFAGFHSAASAIPAFPGAEGAGANALGGRGGDVYFVTTTNNTGTGSLRSGIAGATGPRTILFRVSGNIDLASDLVINKPNLIIAGQTAPGDGITLRRRTTRISANNVVVRHLRFRPGDLDSAFEGDALWVTGATNVMVDHVSSSWSVDECLSVTHSTNVTIQWSMISESLKLSQHAKGSHGYGSLLRYGAGALTFHHNLYQHHDSRNPRLGDRIQLDFVNNVIYNWGGRAGYSGDDAADNPADWGNFLNYVGNTLIAGPSTGPSSQAFLGGATNTVIYQSGNFIDSNKNGVHDGSNTGWGMFSNPYTASGTRYPLPLVSTDAAHTAYQRVLAFAGASKVRDSVDARLIGTVRGRNGRLIDAVGSAAQATDYVTNNINGTNYVFVRGWPVLSNAMPPADSDNDGIPNDFEIALGWNPATANNNHVNADGYTDLEWYLNWLADAHAEGGMNQPCLVNLRALTGMHPNLTFHNLATTNGSVALMPDGYTARYVPGTNFMGLTRFTFSATNSADLGGFGPMPVVVLVKTNLPPVLAPLQDRSILAGVTLQVTNNATDPDLPAQNLTFQLLQAPAGSEVNTNGVFSWRPPVAASDLIHPVTVAVTDSGALTATQSFSVNVLKPVAPVVGADRQAENIQLTISGDSGPDYIVQASTNLVDWATVASTNSPVLPWRWTDEETSTRAHRFYRILLGP